MTAAAILSVFAGMLLGLRLRVTALVPATVLIGIVTCAFMMMKGEGLSHALAVAAISVTAIQIGYLCATFAASLKEAPEQEASAPAHVTPANSVKPVVVSDR